VLLGFAYLVYFIFSKKDRKKITGFVILFASVIPFVAVNIYWNYTHCWANILFNLFNRNKKETLSAGKFLIFIVSQLYLITPPVVYYAFKRRKELLKDIAAGRLVYFAFLVVVPLIIFGALSFKKVVGLHWVLAFYPFMYLALFAFLTDLELTRSIRFMVFFTLVHLFLIGAALSVPVHYLKSNKNYKIIVLGTHPKEIIRHLRPYKNEFSFATPSYSDSAVISFYFGRYFMVFGGGSHHGRQDDFITDFRQLQGRNILILRESLPSPKEYAPFFSKIEIKEVTVLDAAYYLVLGYGFNYENYREKILRPIKDNYYAIPPYLPAAPCSGFLGKYFGS
jgi:hypothetical protein